MTVAETVCEHDFPPRRVVLLGASNLTRGFSTAMELSRQIWGGPIEILAALGHGRSYGIASSVLGRRLPGIIQCGLWEALNQRPVAPTAAVVTDIGNDLLYDIPVDQIAVWVEFCLDRFAAAEARTVVTALPVENLNRVSPSRFVLFRTLFVPTCRLELPVVAARACELNQRVVHLADHFGAELVRPSASWYGLDPIHIKIRRWRPAWKKIFSPFSDGPPPAGIRGSFFRWVYLRSLCPFERRVFGFEQRQTQPAGRLKDGSTISLY